MDKTDRNYTHIAIVLDASGSMARLRESTIAKTNELFEMLKSSEERAVVDLWQFNDRVEHLIDGMDDASSADEAIEHYTTGGRTALYDAICIGIDELGRKFAAISEADRPDAVVFAILTDGFENASRNFSAEDVAARIGRQTKQYNWKFRFLEANQDAVVSGGRLGIACSACRSFLATEAGMRQMCLMKELDIGRVRAKAVIQEKDGERKARCA